MKLWTELKRRNVFRVAVFYIVAAWVVVQVAVTVLPMFEVPPARRGRFRMRLKQYLMSAIATMLVAAGASGSERCTDDDQARAIEAQRHSFNQAIEKTDLDTIAALLADDVLLITGTDSDLYSGRRAQVDLWRSDFESDERLVYVRTPECIQVSERFPIALERGRWRGERGDGSPGLVQGAYSAKWRHDGTDWRLEVEVYMTDKCSASICPEDEASP